MVDLIKKYKKYIIAISAVLVAIFIGKVVYACTYVGDIVISYPWDEYTFTEKVAATISGYNEHQTKQELYDQRLIENMNGPFTKFSEYHYRKKK